MARNALFLLSNGEVTTIRVRTNDHREKTAALPWREISVGTRTPHFEATEGNKRHLALIQDRTPEGYRFSHFRFVLDEEGSPLPATREILFRSEAYNKPEEVLSALRLYLLGGGASYWMLNG